MNKHFNQIYEAICDCGNKKNVNLSNLKSGLVKSCGCLQQEALNLRKKHGHSTRTVTQKEYSSWQHMKQRCLNPNNQRFKHYGGRGIVIHSPWINSYQQFLQDMGRMPAHCNSIDRINNDGNYEPSNCRWATKDQQLHNQRRKVKRIK